MATSELMTRAHKFRDEIHKRTRAEQLAWLGRVLGIDEKLLLRLIGYQPSTIAKKLAAGAKLIDLAAAKTDETIWVTELLREMASRHGYDIGRLAGSFKGQAPVAVKVAFSLPTSKKGSASQQKIPSLLLRQIRAGGPSVYHDLTDYILLMNKNGNAQRTPAKKA